MFRGASCDLFHNASHVTYPHGQTDASENITFPQLLLQAITRQHYNKMHTAHLPTICVFVATTRHQYQYWGWG